MGIAGAAIPAFAAGARPNFVIVYVDDMGYGDVGAFGGRTIATPNLDRMARGGMALTDYYAPANLCTPSRAGLPTGRYPVRTGLAKSVLLQGDKRGLLLTEVTIGKALKPAYATALIGKWRLGNPGTPFWPPVQHGFDLFYGIQYSHDMLPLSLWEGDASGLRQAEVDYPSPQQQFYARAERFIEDNRARPFFLELALSGPHLPNYPFGRFAGSSRAGAYGDVVAELDAIVGRLQAKLETLGLSRQTLVVFSSDNGPWFEGSAGPLRGRKGGGAYDGSRVPFIASRPGTIPAGRRSSSIAMGIDMLPTLCAMAGLPTPAGVELDGLDLSAVFTRGAVSPHHELLLFNDEDVVGIRTQRWKYVADSYYRNLMLPVRGRGYPQLYDMRIAGKENYSVASLHPDIVRAMDARLERATAKYTPFRTAPSDIIKIPPSFREHVPAQWQD